MLWRSQRTGLLRFARNDGEVMERWWRKVYPLARIFPWRNVHKRIKVFWFFFSKKNRLLPYQVPMFGALAQGSATGRASPSCSSSTEMPSGVFTKAIFPSRGGRLMVTPCFCRAAQVS